MSCARSSGVWMYREGLLPNTMQAEVGGQAGTATSGLSCRSLPKVTLLRQQVIGPMPRLATNPIR